MHTLLVTLLAVAPIPIPPVHTVAESCDPRMLAPMLSTSGPQATQLLAEVDRRIQGALFEERQTGADEARLRRESEATGERTRAGAGVAALGGALGVAIGFALARRGKTGPAALAFALGLGAGAAAFHSVGRALAREGERRALVEHRLDLVECRLRLQETKATLLHSQYARALGELGEVDEDVGSWVGQIGGGQPVRVEQVTRLRAEVQQALK